MKLLAAFTVAVLLSAPALSAPCRDAKGHFAKCPAGAAPSAMPAGVTKDAKGRCHAAGGKFVACPK